MRGSCNGLIVFGAQLPSASHCCQACEYANPNKVHGYSCSNWSCSSSPDGCGIGVPYGTCQLKASSEDPALGLSWSFDPREPWTSGEPPGHDRPGAARGQNKIIRTTPNLRENMTRVKHTPAVGQSP